MPNTFDRRVVPTRVLEFIRLCQQRVPCHLGGGAALSGAYLCHRVTGDIDLFSHDAEEMRLLVRVLSDVASQAEVSVTVLRDAGSLVRARMESPEVTLEIDIVHEPIADIEPPPKPIEGVVVESLVDLRASKLRVYLGGAREQCDRYLSRLCQSTPVQFDSFQLMKCFCG